MRYQGWDIKYAIWIFLGVALSYPLFVYVPDLILLTLGVILLVAGSRKIVLFRSIAKWQRTQGKLLKVDIGSYKVSQGSYALPTTYYYPVVEYTYLYAGDCFDSSQYALDRKSICSSDERGVRNTIEHIQNEEPLSVYVNPSRPSQAVIDKSISADRWSHAIALAVSGVLLFIIAVALYAYG